MVSEEEASEIMAIDARVYARSQRLEVTEELVRERIELWSGTDGTLKADCAKKASVSKTVRIATTHPLYG